MTIEYPGTIEQFKDAITKYHFPKEVTVQFPPHFMIVTFERWGTSEIWFEVLGQEGLTQLVLYNKKIAWLHKKHEGKIRHAIAQVAIDVGGAVS